MRRRAADNPYKVQWYCKPSGAPNISIENQMILLALADVAHRYSVQRIHIRSTLATICIIGLSQTYAQVGANKLRHCQSVELDASSEMVDGMSLTAPPIASVLRLSGRQQSASFNKNSARVSY